MGTSLQWIHGLSVGAIFGVMMFMWDALTKQDCAETANIVGLILLSLSFGMMAGFGWQVLRMPLVLLFAPLIVALGFVCLVQRRARKRKQTSS